MDTNTNQSNTPSTNSQPQTGTSPADTTKTPQNAVASAPAAPTQASPTAGTEDIFAQFAERIIKEQEGIIGPIAYEQASKVSGITIDPTTHAVKLAGDKKQILENLVKQYELLFGRVSIEICKEAVRGVIANAPADQVPQILL